MQAFAAGFSRFADFLTRDSLVFAPCLPSVLSTDFLRHGGLQSLGTAVRAKT